MDVAMGDGLKRHSLVVRPDVRIGVDKLARNEAPDHRRRYAPVG